MSHKSPVPRFVDRLCLFQQSVIHIWRNGDQSATFVRVLQLKRCLRSNKARGCADKCSQSRAPSDCSGGTGVPRQERCPGPTVGSHSFQRCQAPLHTKNKNIPRPGCSLLLSTATTSLTSLGRVNHPHRI